MSVIFDSGIEFHALSVILTQIDLLSVKMTTSHGRSSTACIGRGDASADDSLRREVGSQSLNTVDEDDADARHLLGPLLDDLGDGGPSTNRRG